MRTARAFLLAISIAALLPSLQAQSRAVAVTVDDLPLAGISQPLTPADSKIAQQINQKLLRGFSRHHTPAIGFLNQKLAEQLGVDTSTKILRQWLHPGFDLGNHFYSHADVNSLTFEQVQEEIVHGEGMLTTLLASVSRKPEFLRFPFNHTGDTKEKHDAIAAFLASHGYRVAPCTIDNQDWEFNSTYVLALSLHDKAAAAKVRADYLAYTAAEIDWYTALNKQVLGYDPPQVMLLHDNQLNADTIDSVLKLFEQRGYKFVPLSQALSDHAYSIPETYVTQYGPMWGYRWAKELNVKVDGSREPEAPSWIAQYRKDHAPKQ